jgi:hypothetical protein
MNKYRIIQRGGVVHIQLKGWWFYSTVCREDNFDTTGSGCGEVDLIPINFKTMANALNYVRYNISKKESFT